MVSLTNKLANFRFCMYAECDRALIKNIEFVVFSGIYVLIKRKVSLFEINS